MKQGYIVRHKKHAGSEGEIIVCDSKFAIINWLKNPTNSLTNSTKYLISNLELVNEATEIESKKETIEHKKQDENNEKQIKVEDKFDFDLYNRKLPNGIILPNY